MDEESELPHPDQKSKFAPKTKTKETTQITRIKVTVGLTTAELENLLWKIPPDESTPQVAPQGMNAG